jgi:hypothetical protein
VRDFFADGANPIAIKELRQAVRGRFVVATLVLCLLGEAVVVSVMMIGQQLNSTSVERAAVGPMAFMALFSVLFLAAIFFIPMYTGLRMMSERSDTNVDLLFITTIRPWSIVTGKVLGSTALAGLLFSASMPFLIFCYVLRGIDFLSIITLSVMALVVIVSQAILALFVGSLPASKPFKVLLGLFLFGFTWVIYFPTLTLAEQFVRMGSGPTMSRSIPIGLTALSLILAIDLLLMVTTAALISPVTANRALPLRILLAIYWLLSLVAVELTVDSVKDVWLIAVWASTELSLAALVLFSAIGEREEWGPRVARTIPRTRVGRLMAFVFYSGGGGGTVWALIAMMATIAAAASVARSASLTSAGVAGQIRWMIEACLAAVGYALTALLVRRKVLSRRVPAQNTWAVALLLFFLGAIFPPVIFFSMFSETPRFNQYYYLATIANPFPMTGGAITNPNTAALVRLVFLSIWAGVMLLANGAWIAAQFQRFRRTETRPAAAGIAGMAPS